jgi:hypothetical protein
VASTAFVSLDIRDRDNDGLHRVLSPAPSFARLRRTTAADVCCVTSEFFSEQ